MRKAAPHQEYVVCFIISASYSDSVHDGVRLHYLKGATDDSAAKHVGRICND